jgi:hypothetical protein
MEIPEFRNLVLPVVVTDQPWLHPIRGGIEEGGQKDRICRASPMAAFFGLVSTHFASSGSVRFPGNRDRRLSVLTMLGGAPHVK